MVSGVVVIAACSLILIRGSLADAAGTTWFWLFVLSDIFDWRLGGHPMMYAAFTAVVLLLASLRRGFSVAATIWFVLNALGGVWFLSVYDGHS